MHFVKDGPDVPEELIEAHEDGRVVFFCGAGISYSAGLPGFKGLVDELYTHVGTIPNKVEQIALDGQQYDSAIDLLERRVAGGRFEVRQHLSDILKPKPRRRGALNLHRSLLTLAKGKDRHIRLVTTNFDHLFERVLKADKLQPNRYQAPLLPVPKRDRWDGIVYLHGRLPMERDAASLNRLVLSSGDFGLAYLTERWASRFVSELFRTYTVCFVGYSINDPVLRYMMDALAADRSMGEVTPDAYAFASFAAEGFDRAHEEWTAKGVVPILYRTLPTTNSHRLLSDTAQEWSATYRDGIHGRRSIITRDASAKPSPVVSDGQVSRVLWALSDQTGDAAKHFSELDPPPPIEWLQPLTERRYKYRDLRRFGIPTVTPDDPHLSFSQIWRPTPFRHAPWMSPIISWGGKISLDPPMVGIVAWLARHLESPALLSWLIKVGPIIHPTFADLLLRSLATNSVPSGLAIIWRLLCAGRIARKGPRFQLVMWLAEFKIHGWTLGTRLSFLQWLTPQVEISERLSRSFAEEEGHEIDPSRPDSFADCEIVLRDGQDARILLTEAQTSIALKSGLYAVLSSLTGLLLEALELLEELRKADESEDRSYWYLPSIADHPQNEYAPEWTLLIELCRDAWLSAMKYAPAMARLEMLRWAELKFPTFRRLQFFAASHADFFSPEQRLNILLRDNCKWFWSAETKREALRLIASIAAHLTPDGQEQLCRALLHYPHTVLLREDDEGHRLRRVIERERWLRLETYQSAGGTLTIEARDELDRLSTNHPQWRISDDQREEFSSWTSSGEWLGDEYIRTTEPLHSNPEALAEYLRNRPTQDHWKKDDWPQTCRLHTSQALSALRLLARDGVWREDVWREALQAFTDDAHAQESWTALSGTLLDAPDDAFNELGAAVSSWISAITRATPITLESLGSIVHRLLTHYSESAEASDHDPVFRALNHPVGHLIQGVLNVWYQMKPTDNQGLPHALIEILTRVADTRIVVFRHGRLLLAANVIALLRVDGSWTRKTVIPLFNWEKVPDEAVAAWQGFLWSPRLYQPLVLAFKESFLTTAQHYVELAKYADQYASLLALAGLELPGDFTSSQLQEATSRLPPDGLQAVAAMLVRALRGANDRKAEYWTNRVEPYLRKIWPKDASQYTANIRMTLARLCVAADAAFPQAFAMISPWLGPVKNIGLLSAELEQSGLCSRHPHEALTLLDQLLDETNAWSSNSTLRCLEQIEAADPKLVTSDAFKRLRQYFLRLGKLKE